MKRLQQHEAHQTSRATRNAGFTLIEMMAVILILTILVAFLVVRLAGADDTVKQQNTRAFLAQIEASIEEYSNEKGDFPPSTFPKDLDPRPSRTNMGAEMLVISLFPADGSWRGLALPEDRLVNTDGDDTKRSLTKFPNSTVFEIADDWGNPIVYLHRRDYETGADYVTTDGVTGESLEVRVTGVNNSVTGAPFNDARFQLLSAGPDGIFGTGDDIGNFKPRKN